MLPTYVALHDIRDAEAFVQHCITRTGLHVGRDDREELLLEGLSLLVQLERAYEPHREGYAQAGSFRAYAAKYLPLRLLNAWHRRMREDHIELTCEDGVNRWHYFQPARSLNELLDTSNGGGGEGKPVSRADNPDRARPVNRFLPLATPALPPRGVAARARAA